MKKHGEKKGYKKKTEKQKVLQPYKNKKPRPKYS